MLGKHTLQPGEKTELKAVFNTKGSPGPFEKITTLETDIPGQEKIELVMVGTVKEAPGPKISVAPRRIETGVLKTGEKKKQTVAVKNQGELPLTITAISSKKGSVISVSGISLPVTIGPGQESNVEFTVTGDKPGAFNERISVESNARNAPKSGFVLLISGKTE